MSSYIPGLTDQFSPQQQFDPNLGFYAQVLQQKQNQYDSGLAQVNSVYSSALNQPLTRVDNIQRRDSYLKMIEKQLTDTAAKDLSVDQNVASAKKLFDPIIKDKYIVNDMVYTKQLHNSYQQAERYRNCADPEKCQGEFWQEGVQALNYAREEFQKADPNSALGYQAPSYVPYQNVSKLAMKAAKESGFDVSVDSVSGGYIVTDKNGEMLYGKNGQGILPQYLYGLFGSDSKIQQMYATKAYVDRKNFAKSFAMQHGVTEEEGNNYYVNSILTKAVGKLEQSKAELQDVRDNAKTNLTALQIAAQKKGGVVDGDGTEDAYGKLVDLLNRTKETEDYHEKVSNIISTAPHINDLKAYENRIDNIVANASFMNDIDNAARTYAMGTTKREIKADPYALASFNNNLDLNKAVMLKKLDHDYWITQQTLLGNIGGMGKSGMNQRILAAMRSKGLGMDDLYKMGIHEGNFTTKESQQKLVRAGILTEDEAKASENVIIPNGEKFINTYSDNKNVTDSATDNALKASHMYLKTVITNMQQAYKQAENDTDEKNGIGTKAKIIADARLILKDTGINADQLVTGQVSADILNGKDLTKSANMAAIFQMKDKSAGVYNNNWDDNSLMQMQINNQAASGLIQERFTAQKDALNKLKSSYDNDLLNGNINQNEYLTTNLITKASFDENGNKIPVNEAFLKFANSAKELYVRNAASTATKSKITGKSYRTQKEIIDSAMNDMKRSFDTGYEKLSQNFDNNLNSIRSKSGSRDEGGAEASAGSITLPVEGDLPFSQNYIDTKKIFDDIRNNPSKVNVMAEGVSINGEKGMVDSPTKRLILDKLSEKFLNGDTEKMSLTTGVQVIPTANGKFVGLKFIVDDQTARKINNIKPSSPVTPDLKTVIVQVPANSDFKSVSDFINKIEPSSADLMLASNGKSIAVNFPNKGTASIKNQNGSLIAELHPMNFNAELGKWEYGTVVNVPLPSVNSDQAFAVAKSILDQRYEASKLKENLFLENQATDGGTKQQ